MDRTKKNYRENRKNIVVAHPDNPLNKGKSPHFDTAKNFAHSTKSSRKFYGKSNSFETPNCSQIKNKNLLVTYSGKINFYKKDCSNNTAKNNLSNNEKTHFFFPCAHSNGANRMGGNSNIALRYSCVLC